MSRSDYFKIEGPPSDTVSHLSWSPSSDFFVAASWSMDVRCYQGSIQGRDVKAQGKAVQKHGAPVLSTAWSGDGKQVFWGGADGKVMCWDIPSNRVRQVGEHQGGISAVKWSTQLNTLATASWDQTIKYWDLRKRDPAGTLNLPGKALAMDLERKILVTAVAKAPGEQEIDIVDLSAPTKIRKRDNPQLKRYIKAVTIFPDVQAYVIAGLEGRVSVTYFSPDNKSKDFTFKSHRRGQSETEVYPIHAISVNSANLGTFATCGGDGTMAYWDRNGKAKLKSFLQSGGVPVTACAFNRTGRLMVLARGYDWQKGIKGYNRDSYPVSLLLRGCPDADIRPQQSNNRRGGF